MRAVHRHATAIGRYSIIIVALGSWEVAAQLGWISPWNVPPPRAVAAAAIALLSQSLLYEALLITTLEVLSTLALATLIGIPLGWLLYRFPPLGQAYEGWLAALFASPTILLYPVFLVLFGRSYAAIVAMALLASLIPIIINVRAGLLGIPMVLPKVGRALRLSERRLFWFIMLPAALPAVFNGLRLGLIYALVGCIAVEYLVVFGGLGYLVSETHFRYQVAEMYAVILFIIILVASLHWLLGRAQRWAAP